MRLVNADLLKDAMIVACRTFESKGLDTMIARAVISIIDTVAPGEKNGRWQAVSPFVDTEECSICRYNIQSKELETPYCPWCGAKLEGNLEPGEDNADDE